MHNKKGVHYNSIVKYRILTVFSFALAFLISACASDSEVVKYTAPPPSHQELFKPQSPMLTSYQVKTGDTQTGFTLSPGDRLKISVFGDEDFTNEYEIDRQGYIIMPLIGKIQANNKTSTQLQTYIEQELSKGYLVNPRVSVEVMSFEPFYILGEVNNPGSYPYRPSLDVFKAVALAGGLTPRAVKNKFIIIRGTGETKTKITAEEHTPILPGDSIKVKERFF